MLSILQEINQHGVKTSVLMTANTIDQFDQGLLRPGRIDTWLEFLEPDEATRFDIINGYLKETGTESVVDETIKAEIVTLTEGLTQDYLREIAERLTYESIEEVLATIATMRKLLRLAQEEQEESDDEVDEPCSPDPVNLGNKGNGRSTKVTGNC